MGLWQAIRSLQKPSTLLIMKRLLFILLMGIVSHGFAQFDQAQWAEKFADSYQFAKSFELWSKLATEADFSETDRPHFIRRARVTAMKSGLYADALKWSTELIATTSVEYADIEAHVQLLRVNGKQSDVPGFLQADGMDSLYGAQLVSLIATQQAIDGLTKDSMAFEVIRFRPNAKGSEFAAVPYGSGLVFQSTAVDPGITPQKDGWSGKYFTELMLIPDTAVAEPHFTWKEQLKGQDLFLDFGHARTHDGPVAFDAEQDFAVLTRNHSELDSLAAIRLSHLRLEFFWKRPWGWEPARPFSWNSSRYSCGHGAFDLDGNLIFMSDMPGGLGGMDLYRSRWEDGDWSKPENLGDAVNTAGNESFPYISASGFLYFASDGHSGIGGMDVFVHPTGSDYVEHLAAPINSAADDFAFVIDEAKGRGWLSSNRENQTDAIYQVNGKALTGKIEVVVQACDGSPIANAAVELTDGKTANVQSMLTDENGMALLYGWLGGQYAIGLKAFPGMAVPPSQNILLSEDSARIVLDMNFASKQNSLVVIDEQGAPTEGVLLTFEDAQGEQANFVTDAQGRFEWDAASQEDDYVSVKTVLINYNDVTHEFMAPPPGCLLSISDTLTLIPWTADIERIDLANILYDLGSAALRDESKRELDKLVAYMKERPGIRVELSSHTDCRNDEGHNQRLSQQRADGCVDYIIRKGIDSKRILAKGYGESRLLNACSDVATCECAPLNVINCVPCTEALHQQNRRTELRLLAY